MRTKYIKKRLNGVEKEQGNFKDGKQTRTNRRGQIHTHSGSGISLASTFRNRQRITLRSLR